MTLSETLLQTYGVQGRPAPNRLRAIPLVPSNDNRPSNWAAFVKLAFVSFMLGAILYLALIVL